MTKLTRREKKEHIYVYIDSTQNNNSIWNKFDSFVAVETGFRSHSAVARLLWAFGHDASGDAGTGRRLFGR
jgi:hypothetical protein